MIKQKDLILLSKGKLAWAQSQIEDNAALNVLDGRKDTYWKAEPYYQWLKIDLEGIHRIAEIQLDLGVTMNRFYRYFIEYSCDNLNWTLAVDATDNTINHTEPVNYSVDFVARYIRITMTYCSNGMSVQIRNFNVYGYEENEIYEKLPNRSGMKIPAVQCDKSEGFQQIEVDDIEQGQIDRIMSSSCAGSYLLFRQIDFSENGVDHFRGEFGFPCTDKQKHITIELRLDDLNGEVIGTMLAFRQYTPWTELACDLKKHDGTEVKGIHDVYFVMTDLEEPQSLMLAWLSFVKKSPLPTPTQKKQEITNCHDGKYEIYFGNLHSHTRFSDGAAVPEYAYDYARYTAGLDFLAITEHSNLFDEAFDYDKSRKWVDLKRCAKEKTEDGVFLALIGSETTWYNQFGHMNIFNIDFYLNTYEVKYNNVEEYYNTIKQYPNSINQWNHPWSCGNRHLDYFEPYDEEVDQVMYMMEISYLESPYCGGLSYYITALDKGWHVCPVGNQDNHKDNWGTQNNMRTAILMEELTTEHLYDALQHRRAYFTCAIHLKVWFWVNDHIMGSRINKADQYDIRFIAQNRDDESPIIKVEIIGEKGEVLRTITTTGHTVEHKVTLTSQSRYYFMKVYQDNGEYAATAPVWIENNL